MTAIITTINPSTNENINSYHRTSLADIHRLLDKSVTAQGAWEEVNLANRVKPCLNLAKILRENLNDYAALITIEMGKPIMQSRMEIEKCIIACNHYARYSKDYLAPKVIQTENKKSYVSYSPLGIILGIMPWNYPFWQIFRFAVPTIMAGNNVIIKHADNCLGSGNAIEQLFIAAGFPEYTLKHLIIDHPTISDLIKDDRIAALSLTGSNRAGSIVAAQAGKCIKKIVLELGSNDPYIILSDADLEFAAQACLASRLSNTGQVCIAAKRLIVVNEVIDEFKKIILEKIKKFSVGDPFDEKNQLGPIARSDLRINLHKQIISSIELGAKCLLGGIMPDNSNKGFFYPITVLDNITNNMPAYHEELFGPVVCFINAKDEHEAINIANDTKYGLTAAIFTKDLEKGEYLAAHKLKAGTVAVNKLISSDPKLPFGGIKSSGYGRELGQEGMLEFMNIKTVIVN